MSTRSNQMHHIKLKPWPKHDKIIIFIIKNYFSSSYTKREKTTNRKKMITGETGAVS